MTKFCLLSLASLFLANSMLLAQNGNKSQSVARLQPGMVWQVEELNPSERLFRGAPGGAAQNPTGESDQSLSSRLVERNTVGRDHRQQDVVDRDGNWTEQYITSEFLLTRRADGSFSLLTTEENMEVNLPRLRPDRLREFAWTERLSPVTTLRVDGVECEIFALRANGEPVDSVDELADNLLLAAIGKDDGFPRRLESPGRVLRFLPKERVQPTGLPMAARAAVDEYREALRKKVQRYALPR